MNNKTLEAALRGYLFFRVNNKKFLFYQDAKDYRVSIEEGPISFEGYHAVKGWRGFYYRLTNDSTARTEMHRIPDISISQYNG